MGQKTILLITDGIGFNASDKFNAFANAKKPASDYLPGLPWACRRGRWETAK